MSAARNNKRPGEAPIINDAVTIDRLVRENTGLVYDAAKRMRGYCLEWDDMIGAGNEGLVLAAQRFDALLGWKFSTYAIWWIKAKIMSEVARASGVASSKDGRRVFWGLKRELRRLGKLGIENPSSEELAMRLKVTADVVESMRGRLTQTDMHLDAISDSTVTDGFVFRVIGSPATPEDEAMRRDSAAKLSSAVSAAMARLPVRERQIIADRFSESPLTLKDLGNVQNCSRERIRQLEARALEKMRQYLTEMGVEQ